MSRRVIPATTTADSATTSTFAVLPVGSFEQHGPYLPLGIAPTPSVPQPSPAPASLPAQNTTTTTTTTVVAALRRELQRQRPTIRPKSQD